MGSEVDTIGKWISIVNRQSQVYINRELKEYGFNSSEYIYLLNLYEEDGISQEKLSSKVIINKAATARAIDKLERLGYVRRKKDERDKRANKIYISERGLEIKDIIIKKFNYWNAITYKNLSEGEIEDIKGKLKDISKNMAEIITKREDIHEEHK